MKALMVMMLLSLVSMVLLAYYCQDDFKGLQDDIQAYSTRSILPDEKSLEGDVH